MNVNTFRILYRSLEYLLKTAALLLSAVIAGIIGITFFIENASIIYGQTGFTVWLTQRGSIEEAFFSQAAMVAAIFSIGIFVHILWKAAQLFRSLHKGQSPFSVKFISRLRYLACILFAADFLTSAVFSSSLSILASNAYHLELSLGSPFLIGLVLIVTVKVFEYGIALQNLAE